MAVIAGLTSTPVPGKETEAEALMKKSLELMKRFGAKGHVESLVLGGVPGSLSLVLEYPDEEAFGASLDAAYADRDSQAFMERGRKAEALVPVRSTEYSEMSGLEVPFDEIEGSGVIVMGTYRIHHGNHAKAHEWMKRGKKISEKHGVKVRMLQSSASDPTGETATAVYYPSFTAWRRHLKALAADKEWQAYGAEVAKHPEGAEFLRTSVMRVI